MLLAFVLMLEDSIHNPAFTEMYFRQLHKRESTDVPIQAVRTGWNDLHVCAGKLATPFHMTGQDFNSCMIHPLTVKTEDILSINVIYIV